METLIAFYGVFFVGYFLHMMLQVDAQVRAKNNAAASRLTVLKQNVFVLASRFFVSLIILQILKTHPEYLGPFLNLVGAGAIPVAAVTGILSSWIFSGLFGYTIDSLLTFVPLLKNSIPPLNGSGS